MASDRGQNRYSDSTRLDSTQLVVIYYSMQNWTEYTCYSISSYCAIFNDCLDNRYKVWLKNECN